MVLIVLLHRRLCPDNRAKTNQKIAASVVVKMTSWENSMVEASSLIRSAPREALHQLTSLA